MVNTTGVHLERLSKIFVELRVHFEPSTWKAYENTFSEHPVIAIIGNIIEVYKAIGSKTLVMPARYVCCITLSREP